MMRRGTRAVALLAVALLAVALLAPQFVMSPRATAATSPAPSTDKVIAAAISELQAYWADEFPRLYGARYQPIPRARIVAARPGVAIPSCQGHRETYSDVRGNAFYCLHSNFIAYDDARLMPQLTKTFGTFAAALVLAHEWGHAIQDRAGNDNEKTIYMEQQADCFAGGFVRHVGDDGGALKLRAGDLEASLGAMLEIRDAPGESSEDPSAHGSAFDRINAFQDGFESGPTKCAQYFENPPVLVELPFSSEGEQLSQGDVAAEDVIPLTVDLLNEFYSQVEPNYRPLSTRDIRSFDSSKPRSIPSCGGALTRKQVENRVFYCLNGGYIAFDEPFLQSVYDHIGDFGVASLIANPWATYVQTIQQIPGVADNTVSAVFQSDCYTGGWSAALFNGVLRGGNLSPGDLDEFVQAFLVYSRARGVESNVPITFLRVAFFRQGFLQGYNSCGYQGIADAAASLEGH